MIDELKQDLLVQYLLNELDPSAAEKIRVELESDAELRDFVRETEDAMASIAYAAPSMKPPAGLSQRILQVERNAPGRPAAAPRSKIVWFILPWALAACFAIVCGILQLERTRLRDRIEQVSQELAAVSQKNAQVSQELTAVSQKNAKAAEELAALQKRNFFAEMQIATLKAQVSAYGTASAVVVWDKNQKSGVLQLDKLPPAAKGKDYQLWVIDPKIPQPVSAGVLAVTNDGLIRTSFHPTSPIGSAAAFAISIEKSGGASKPEGQIILVGK
jgi:anti-sigma-K factor RskA